MMGTEFVDCRFRALFRFSACSLLLFLGTQTFRWDEDAPALASAALTAPTTPEQTDFAGVGEPAVGSLPAVVDTESVTVGDTLTRFETGYNYASTDERTLDDDQEQQLPAQALSVSRFSRRSKDATRGLKIPAKTLMAILGLTVSLAGALLLGHKLYKSEGQGLPEGSLPELSSPSDLPEALQLSDDEEPVSSRISQKNFLIGMTLAMAVVLATQMLSLDVVELFRAVESPESLLRDVRYDSDEYSPTPAGMLQAVALISAISGAVALLSRQRRRGVDVGEVGQPAREPGREGGVELRKKARESMGKSGPADFVPKDVPVALEVPDTTEQGKFVYGPGSPEVQKVEGRIRKVMEEVRDLSSSRYADLEEQMEALSKAREGQEFEEGFRRLMTAVQRAQLMVVQDNVQKLEAGLHEGKFVGHHAFLMAQVRSHHFFLRTTIRSIDVNGRSLVALLKNKYERDRDGAANLIPFVREETKTLETVALGLERQLTLLAGFTDSDGSMSPRSQKEVRHVSDLLTRAIHVAVQKMEGLVNSDVPLTYARTWM